MIKKKRESEIVKLDQKLRLFSLIIIVLYIMNFSKQAKQYVIKKDFTILQHLHKKNTENNLSCDKITHEFCTTKTFQNHN